MLARIDDLATGVIGLRAVGEFTIDDYREVIEPELERLAIAHEDLRLLLYLGPDFSGFGEGAWGELTDDIRHTTFHRGAVVTDDRMVRMGLTLLSWTLHGHVRTFRNRDYDEAVRWVAT